MTQDYNDHPMWAEIRHQFASQELYHQAQEYAFDYLNTIFDRKVFPTENALNNLAVFDEVLPNEPQSGVEILRLLHEYGSPATIAQIGGRYFGFVNGSIIPTVLAAKWLTDVWDQNAGLYIISPITATLEQQAEKWLVDLFGLPSGTVAGFVSGTSTATMCGFAAGRYALLQRLGWDVNENGLFDAPKLRVVMSEQAHSSVKKALALVGIGNKQIEYVPTDSQGRLLVEDVPPMDDHTILLLQAGNVNTGSFENFDVLCDQARQAGAWVHIDGAFGLWAAACTKTEYLTRGMQKADSWSVDGHKTLNAPYDSGIVLCRDRQALVSAMQASGAYIQFSQEYRDGMLTTPEMSRRSRGIELWATLRCLGRSGVDALVGRLVENAQLFAELLQAQGIPVINDVVFNQVLVQCATPEQTTAMLEHIQQSGVCWCGGTTWNNAPAIRISVCSWVTTPEDIRMSVAAFTAAYEANTNQ